MRRTSFNKRIVRYEEIHAIEQKYFDALAEAAAIRDGDRILDCGCGYGAVVREFLHFTDAQRRSEQWHNVIDLVDESSKQLRRAKVELRAWRNHSTASLNFLLGTFPQDFTWEDRYDVVGVKMVLHEMPTERTIRSDNNEHVTQPQFMKALLRCLKPGGVLVLWDLTLTPTTRDFFCSVIREKDTIAGFRTLVKRRNFLSNEAISSLFADSGLVAVHQVESFDYRFSTKRRLIPELNGNEAALEKWHTHIRNEARGLSDEVLHELAYDDRGDDITFLVKGGIFRANKPSDLRFVLEPFRGQDAGSVNVESPTQSYLPVTKQTLVDGQLLRRLEGYYGLMRASILTRAYTGKRELCREGLDFLYNYPEGPQRFQQTEAYLAYLIGLCCGKEYHTRGLNLRSMSDALSHVFGASSSAGWLIASLKDADTLRVEIGSYNSVTGQVLMKIPSSINEFFVRLLHDLDGQRELFDFQPVDSLALVRIATNGRRLATKGAVMDSAAKILSENYRTLWEETVGVIRDQDMTADVLLPCPHLNELLKLRVVLANLCGYLKFSGTPYCYYVLPPSLRMNDARLEEGVFVLSSPTRLRYDRFEALLKYVSGFWSGIGSLEGLAYGQQRQEQEEQVKRNQAVAGFTHQVGHVLEAKSGLSPLRDFADMLVTKSLTLQTVIGAEEDFEFRAAQTRYACLLPRVFANTMESLTAQEQSNRMWGNAGDIREIINYVWLKLILPCARAAGRANPKFGTAGRTAQLVWKNQCGVSIVPNNEVVEAVLFELFWNACRHGCFVNDPEGRALIELRMLEIGGTAVELTVTNPAANDTTYDKEKHCRHLLAFIGTLHSWDQALRANLFDIKFDVRAGKWTSSVTLPVQPQDSGG